MALRTVIPVAFAAVTAALLGAGLVANAPAKPDAASAKPDLKANSTNHNASVVADILFGIASQGVRPTPSRPVPESAPVLNCNPCNEPKAN